MPNTSEHEHYGLLGDKKSSLLQVVQVFICLLTYVFFVRLYLPFPSTVEDSFILFRYANHLASHEGLSWNVGYPRPQGMTGIAWAIIVAVSQWIVRGDIAVTAAFDGVVIGCLTVIFFYYALRQALPRRHGFLAFVGSLALVLSPLFQRHTASGMETILVFFVFAVTIFTATKLPVDRPRALLLAATLISALAFVVRPDTTIFCLVVFLGMARRESINHRFVGIGKILLAVMALIGFECLFLGKYFTTFLPLPVYLKMSVEELRHDPYFIKKLIPWILSFQMAFLSTVVVWLVCVALACITGINRSQNRIWSILIGSAIFYVYLFTVIPIMNFNMRYQAPLLVPIIFCGIVALARLRELINPAAKSSVAATSLLFLSVTLYSLGDISDIKSAMRIDLQDHLSFQILGQRLRPITNLRIASTEAGVLAFYSDQLFLDLIGLNDTFIAKNHNRSKYNFLLNNYLSSDFGYPDVYVRKLGGTVRYSDLCSFPEIIRKYDFWGTMDSGPQIFVLRDSKYSNSIFETLNDSALRRRHTDVIDPCQR